MENEVEVVGGGLYTVSRWQGGTAKHFHIT
jgi:hypothetical protein